MDFSLYEREVDDLVEGLTQSKYLVITLDQYDDDWPVIQYNIRRAQKFWVQLLNILRC